DAGTGSKGHIAAGSEHEHTIIDVGRAIELEIVKLGGRREYVVVAKHGRSTIGSDHGVAGDVHLAAAQQQCTAHTIVDRELCSGSQQVLATHGGPKGEVGFGDRDRIQRPGVYGDGAGEVFAAVEEDDAIAL